MRVIRGGRKLTARERSAGGPDLVLDGTVVKNPRYGKRGELKWQEVHFECVLPGDQDWSDACPDGTAVAGIHVQRDTEPSGLRCVRCGQPFAPTRPHLTIVD